MMFASVLLIWAGLDWQAMLDAERFQGTWVITSVEHGGKCVLPPEWPYIEFIFDGGRARLQGVSESDGGTFELRSLGARPCQCNFFLNAHTWMDYIGRRQTICMLWCIEARKALYELDGDCLRICTVEPSLGRSDLRPADSTTHPDDLRWLYVLERRGSNTGTKKRTWPEGCVGLWQATHPDGERLLIPWSFRCDGDTITIRVASRILGQGTSEDGYYRVRAKWMGDDLWYLVPFTAWQKWGTFKGGKFEASEGAEEPWIFEKIDASKLPEYDRPLALEREPYDYLKLLQPPPKKAFVK